MLSNAEQNINNLALKLSAEAASTNNVSYETLISQWLDQIVLAEKTKAQMEARDIMRENLNEDFLYFSPIGATLGRKERHIGFVESNYMSTMGALNAAILRQKNLEMTSASLKIMNPPLFPLTSSPTNARMIILASILGTLLFIIGYFLIIEILDRTLRDKIRTERITGGTVIGAYPKESKLRYRRYNKAINEIGRQATQHRFIASSKYTGTASYQFVKYRRERRKDPCRPPDRGILEQHRLKRPPHYIR